MMVLFAILERPGMFAAGVAGSPAIDVSYFTQNGQPLSRRPRTHPQTFGASTLLNDGDKLEDPRAAARVSSGPCLAAAFEDGEWFAYNSMGNASGHRRTAVPLNGEVFVSQRFAVDWVRLDEDGTFFQGDAVSRGDRLGLLGNSGNSDAPHLHFQWADGPEALGAQGRPFSLDAFTLRSVAAEPDAVAEGADREEVESVPAGPREYEAAPNGALISFSRTD